MPARRTSPEPARSAGPRRPVPTSARQANRVPTGEATRATGRRPSAGGGVACDAATCVFPFAAVKRLVTKEKQMPGAKRACDRFSSLWWRRGVYRSLGMPTRQTLLSSGVTSIAARRTPIPAQTKKNRIHPQQRQQQSRCPPIWQAVPRRGRQPSWRHFLPANDANTRE